jgi:signal transduction histidine kinase
MAGTPPTPPNPGAAPRPFHRVRDRRPGGFLGGMRVRKKLMFLHTAFSLGLAAILLIALRPAIGEVVDQAEVSQSAIVLRLVLDEARRATAPGAPLDTTPDYTARLLPQALFVTGTAEELGLTPGSASAARADPGRVVPAFQGGQRAGAVVYLAPPEHPSGAYWLVTARIPEARAAVVQLYGLVTAALLAVYALVAAALELFVLPQNVYGPIQRMLDADAALQQGRTGQEIIPESAIPADELGEIMRSRNQSVASLRRHEKALGEALAELERVALDLKRKNHLLEAARRNLADADRLASLGMMSAGIAHELNTPLSVLSGLVEGLSKAPEAGVDPTRAALMLRVVRRLERLSDSLLDFARARAPRTTPVRIREVVDEAATLVRLDREASDVDLVVEVSDTLVVACDAGRMVQVFVNLIRNAIDAVRSRPPGEPRGRVNVAAEASLKDGREWVSLTVTDNGPGIHPDVLPRLFEPFASTRLDSQGTGLGLAVAEGIVREHGGLILARNLRDGPGAVFEVLIPVRPDPYPHADPASALAAPRNDQP